MNPLLQPDTLHRLTRGERLSFDSTRFPFHEIQSGDLAQLLIEHGASLPLIHLVDLRIVGPVLLNSAHPLNGTSFPALLAEACTFTGAIDLSHTTFARLSLHGSKIVRLVAVGTTFGAELDLTGLSSSEADDTRTGYSGGATCQVNLRDARIQGAVLLSRSRLVAPKEDASFDLQAGRYNYAVDLRNATVEGDIVAQPRFEAAGGAGFGQSQVKGTLWLKGATLRAGSRVALSLQQAHVRGSVVITAESADVALGPLLVGSVTLRNAVIEGELYLTELLLTETPSEFAVDGTGLRVTGGVHLDGTCIGRVYLGHASFGAALTIGSQSGLYVAAQFLGLSQWRAVGLSLEGSTVARDLIVRDLVVDDPIERMRRVFDRVAFKAPKQRGLACYPGWSLCRLTYTMDGRLCYVYLLFSDRAAYLIDGSPLRFHTLNRAGALRLDDDDKAREYVRLFCHCLRGPHGGFTILPDTPSADGPSPLAVVREAEMVRVTAPMQYADQRFSTVLKVPTAGTSMGNVEMVEDRPAGEALLSVLLDPPLVRLLDPQIDAEHAVDPFFPDGWQDMDEASAETMLLLALKDKGRVRRLRGRVDLRGLSVHRLDDLRGTAFGRRALLDLQGFTYESFVDARSQAETVLVNLQEQITSPLGVTLAMKALAGVGSFFMAIISVIDTLLWPVYQLVRIASAIRRWYERLISPVPVPPRRPTEPVFRRQTGSRWQRMWQAGRANQYDSALRSLAGEWRWRNMWLGQQYLGYTPDGLSYRPQPYHQAVEAFGRMGKVQDAKRLQSELFTLERRFRTRWMWKPFALFYSWGFDYGLSPARAAVTMLLCITIGWLGTHYLNAHGMLVTQTMATAGVAVVESRADGQRDKAAPRIEVWDRDRTVAYYECADGISELVYAVDVFIPLIDLRQEERCDVIARSDFSGPSATGVDRLTALLLSPNAWAIAKAAYAFAGWIVTSLAILTFTGVLGRTAMEKA
jgi:hypothetical protein